MFFKKHKNDTILVLAVLLVAASVLVYSLLTRQEGGEVCVAIGGGEAVRFSLYENREISLGEGERSNTLIISDGTARITQASCPDHVCVNSGAIRYEGETIVCLPNETIVTIEGAAASVFDAVVG